MLKREKVFSEIFQFLLVWVFESFINFVTVVLWILESAHFIINLVTLFFWFCLITQFLGPDIMYFFNPKIDNTVFVHCIYSAQGNCPFFLNLLDNFSKLWFHSKKLRTHYFRKEWPTDLRSRYQLVQLLLLA